jgi:hypothetical protein
VVSGVGTSRIGGANSAGPGVASALLYRVAGGSVTATSRMLPSAISGSSREGGVSVMRSLLRSTAVLAAVAVLGAASVASAAPAAGQKSPPKHRSTLAGTWSGKYSGAFSGTFTLHWTRSGSSLTGSITLSNPSGKYSVTGSVSGSAIKFGAVGAGATYTGSVSGNSMSGRYKTPRGVGTWSAQKTS